MTAAPFIHIEPQRLHRPYRLHKVFGVFGTPKRARTREIPPPLPIRAAFLLPTRRHFAVLPPICHETLFVYNFIDRRKKWLKIEMAAFLALLYFIHFLPPPVLSLGARRKVHSLTLAAALPLTISAPLCNCDACLSLLFPFALVLILCEILRVVYKAR